MPTVTLSSSSLKIFFCGPLKLRKYYKKIALGQKRGESICHFASIIMGLILGLLLSHLIFHSISLRIGRMFNLQAVQILVDVAFAFFVGFLFSSLFYGISRGLVDICNIYRYGYANSQLRSLIKKEIDLIIANSKNVVDIDENGVKQIHESLCRLICTEKYKAERQKLKTAHLLFRRGNITGAFKTNLIVADVIAAGLVPSELSRRFLRSSTNIACLVNNVADGVSCSTLACRVERIATDLKNLLSDILVLQQFLERERNEDDDSMQVDRETVSEPMLPISRSRNVSSVGEQVGQKPEDDNVQLGETNISVIDTTFVTASTSDLANIIVNDKDRIESTNDLVDSTTSRPFKENKGQNDQNDDTDHQSLEMTYGSDKNV